MNKDGKVFHFLNEELNSLIRAKVVTNNEIQAIRNRIIKKFYLGHIKK